MHSSLAILTEDANELISNFFENILVNKNL